MSIQVDVSNVDWELLRSQKKDLVDFLNRHSDSMNLLGIVHLLDYIQDEVAEQIGEEKVFGIRASCYRDRVRQTKSKRRD